MFSTFSHGYPFNYGEFLFADKNCQKSSATEMLYEGKGYNLELSVDKMCI